MLSNITSSASGSALETQDLVWVAMKEYKAVYKVVDATWIPFDPVHFAITNDLAVVTRAIIKKLQGCDYLLKAGADHSARLASENGELKLYISNVPLPHRITVPVEQATNESKATEVSAASITAVRSITPF